MPILNYKNHQPTLGEGVFIAPGAFVIGEVTLGACANVWYNAVIRGAMAAITIGEATNLQVNVTIHVDEDVPTLIGNRVTVGRNVVLHGCTVIGRDSLVGADSLITPGTVIPPRPFFMLQQQ